MGQFPQDSHICQMVKFPHAVLSAAAEYKIIGALPALIKLVASVAQFAIALAVTVVLFFNSGAAHYIKHAGEEIGHSISLLVNSFITCEGSNSANFKDRVIYHMRP